METYALFTPVIIPARRLTRLLLFAVPPLVGLLVLVLGRDLGLPPMYGRLGFDLLPTAGWLSGNPALDLLFSLLTGHLEARTAVFVVATIQGLGFVLLFLIAHRSLVIDGAGCKVAVCSAVAAVGLFGGASSWPIALIPMKALSIVGSYVGNLRETEELLDLVRTKNIAPIPVTTMPLTKADEALNALKSGKLVGRAVLTP